METYTLPNFPPNIGTVTIAYFTKVTNAREIRTRIVDAARTAGPEGDALRAAVDFAFIDASTLVSRQHLTAAILAAVLTSLPQVASASLDAPPEPKTRSHNIHSEVLCALTSNNNISKAIARFGVGDDTERLVVVNYGDGKTTDKEMWDRIAGVVQGQLTSVDELDAAVDWSTIDKLYKIEEMNHIKIPADDKEAMKKAAVVNIVAVKHAM